MRKRFVTTLISGILAVACAFGFTACGSSNEIPKGAEVTEEEWKTAIEATLAATNFTVDMSSESNYTETSGDTTRTSKETSTGTGYVTDGGYYLKTSDAVKTTGAANGKDVEYTGDREQYYTVDGQTLWKCTYTKYNYKKGGPETVADAVWNAESEAYGSAELAKEYLASFAGRTSVLSVPYAATKEDEYKTLVELYSAFTYSGGKYSATLYSNGSNYSIEVSVKDGYVIGFSITESGYNTEDGETVKYESREVYAFKNYKTTTVSAPDGATQAINAKK